MNDKKSAKVLVLVLSILIWLMVILAITLIQRGRANEEIASARSRGYDSGYKNGLEDGYSEGYEKGYDDGYSDGYSKGHDAGLKELRPVARPASGTILSGKKQSGSELTVTASKSEDCVVMVKNSSGEECVSFYVRAGDTVTMDVPAKHLRVYFASGNEWYGFGKGLMFGEATSYSKDDELLDFTQYTWEYTLYPVTDGNFSEVPSNENEFF